VILCCFDVASPSLSRGLCSATLCALILTQTCHIPVMQSSMVPAASGWSCEAQSSTKGSINHAEQQSFTTIHSKSPGILRVQSDREGRVKPSSASFHAWRSRAQTVLSEGPLPRTLNALSTDAFRPRTGDAVLHGPCRQWLVMHGAVECTAFYQTGHLRVHLCQALCRSGT
jgi:hypothetical protein